MCLSDTGKKFQTRKWLKISSLVGAPKGRDRNKFPQAGQIAINGNWNRSFLYNSSIGNSKKEG